MDIYTYVASSNPYQAKAILHKYGYSTQGVQDEEDLGVCLKKLVAYEGEDAFNDILSNHPDSNVLIEKFNSEKKDSLQYTNYSGHGCSCGCKNNDKNYNNFSGDATTKTSSSTKEVSVFIMAAALMLAAAIIVKK